MKFRPALVVLFSLAMVSISGGEENLEQAKPLSGLKHGHDVQLKVRDKYVGEDLAGMHAAFRLTNKRGEVRDRLIHRYVKDYNGKKKYLIRIVKPADLRKVGLLMWENKDADDTRFLYIPALKKTRRIASGDRGQSFLGSDFTFEDLGTVPVEDYTYSDTTTVTRDGRECHYYVCTAKKGGNAIYSKVKTWTCKKSFLRIRMEMFDKKGKLYKVFTAQNIKHLPAGKKKVWTPHHLTMRNVQDGHKTEFIMPSVKYNLALPDKLFSRVNLERLSAEDL